jgi:endo-1,4-beta-xylanase
MLTAGAMAARAAPSMAIAQAGASLGANAAERGILLGSAVTNECLSDKAYRDILFAQSRMLVPEWDMTFHFLRPQRGSFNTAPADQLVERARAAQIPIRGQTLIWDDNQPDWLRQLTKGELQSQFDRHIDETIAHFGSALYSWDVVNEPFWPGHGAPGGFRRGVCLDAIGLQSHLQARVPFDAERFGAFLAEIAKRGLDIYCTEIDVNDEGLPDSIAGRDAAVAARLSEFLKVVLAEPRVRMLTFWQMGDRFSWYRSPYYLKGASAERRRVPARPCLYDDALNPKPAWHALADAFDERAPTP